MLCVWSIKEEGEREEDDLHEKKWKSQLIEDKYVCNGIKAFNLGQE